MGVESPDERAAKPSISHSFVELSMYCQLFGDTTTRPIRLQYGAFTLGSALRSGAGVSASGNRVDGGKLPVVGVSGAVAAGGGIKGASDVGDSLGESSGNVPLGGVASGTASDAGAGEVLDGAVGGTGC